MRFPKEGDYALSSKVSTGAGVAFGYRENIYVFLVGTILTKATHAACWAAKSGVRLALGKALKITLLPNMSLSVLEFKGHV